MIKKIGGFVILFFSLILLNGCWDRIDISDQEFIIGMGIDYSEETDEYVVTLEFEKSSSSSDGEAESILITGNGKSIHKALENISSGFSSSISLSHCDMILLGEKIAKKGIHDLVDNTMREENFQNTINFVIAKNATAHEILKLKPFNGKVISMKIIKMIQTESNIISVNSPVYSLLSTLNSDTGSAVATAIEMQGEEDKKTIKLAGIAIFNKDKLAGFLNCDETMYYLFVTGKIKSGILENNKDSTNFLTGKIIRSNTAIHEKLDDKKIHMQINLNARISINEIYGDYDPFSLDQNKAAEQELSEVLTQNTTAVITKVQKEFGCDIFGFGRIIANKHRQKWKSLKENWPQEFSNIDISVVSNVKINDTSQTMKKKAET